MLQEASKMGPLAQRMRAPSMGGDLGKGMQANVLAASLSLDWPKKAEGYSQPTLSKHLSTAMRNGTCCCKRLGM